MRSIGPWRVVGHRAWGVSEVRGGDEGEERDEAMKSSEVRQLAVSCSRDVREDGMHSSNAKRGGLASVCEMQSRTMGTTRGTKTSARLRGGEAAGTPSLREEVCERVDVDSKGTSDVEGRDRRAREERGGRGKKRVERAPARRRRRRRLQLLRRAPRTSAHAAHLQRRCIPARRRSDCPSSGGPTPRPSS